MEVVLVLINFHLMKARRKLIKTDHQSIEHLILKTRFFKVNLENQNIGKVLYLTT